jgi:ketosteroid isomerase-like protein
MRHVGKVLRILGIGIAAATLAPEAATAAPAQPAAEAPGAASLRSAIERAYERNRQALLSRDVAAVQALRTEDFHVVTPDGTTHDAAEMLGFTRNLLGNVQQWLDLSFEIGPLEQHGEEVGADIRQHSVRLQRRNDGNVHRIENWVTQHETWVHMPQGWKMRRVENIRDQRVLIDGMPR